MPFPTPPSTPDPQAALRSLRQRAERRRLVAEALPADASPEVQRLVQELQVHQIELEMQNEELLLAQAEAENSRLQYIDLYDFAPVGYCTLAPTGIISQLNLRTGTLLGKERRQLLGRRLALFVVPADRNQFAEFVAGLWARPGQRQSCELAMRRADETPFFAQLEGVVASEGDDELAQPTACRLVLIDVTARRQATDTLTASEARFRATFEQARDGMVLLNGQTFVDLNTAAQHLLGYSEKKSVLGRDLTDFWPEYQPNGRRTADMLTACLKTAHGRGWCRLEWLRYSPAGEELWDELSFNPVVVNGQLLLHVAWRDITARKHNEQQLAESEARLQMAMTAAEAGVWSWELDSDQLHQDAHAQAVFGLAPAAGTTTLPFGEWKNVIHPADLARVESALAQARRAHTLFDLEHRLLLPDSSVRHVAATGRFNYDEHSGQALRLIGLVRDITARCAVEEELSYKNRLLQNILQNLPVLLARLGPDGRYREHVGVAVGRLGLAQNELVGQVAAEVFPSALAHFEKLLSGENDNCIVSVQVNDQPVHLQCFGFFDQEQHEAVIFALDITDSERFKEEATRLRLRQQQEVLSAILSTQEEERRRIAEALHNGVGQLLYGTRLHLDSLPPSEAVRASKDLLNEAIRATRNISFELTPTILEDFGLRIALEELVSRIPASLSVDLNLHGLDEPLPPLLATAVYRIVQELLNNVMKHAQAKEVFVEVSKEDDQLYFSVEDDGIGLDTSAPSKRNGIGLAGIRTRVGLLGGTFDCKSQPGRGTGCFVQVPVPQGG